MMRLRVAFLALMLAASGASAQTKKELVAKLISMQQTGIESIGRTLAAQVAQQTLQAAGQAMPRVAADKREAVGKDVQAEVKKFHDEVEPLLRERAVKLATPTLTPLYEERFSEEELKQVIAWLESPVSKKFAQLDRELGQNLAEKVVADTRPTVEVKLRALQASVAKRMGLPQANNNAGAAASGGASAPKK
jgi:uncharacterized protein